MKKIICALLALASSVAFSATLVPVQLLNPAGSTSGQAIVSTGPTTPFTTGAVGLNGITAIGANTLIGNATGSSATPTAIAVSGCNGAAQALQWTNGAGFGCNSAVATSGANSNISSLNAPALGAATATTAAAGTNTTQVATTAFVQAINAGRLLNVQVFTANGTYTPTTGTSKVIVEVQASGGGGGGVAATGAGQAALAQSGGAGAFARALVTSGFSGAAITMPAGGAAGAAGANAGATASAASFGSIVSCPGGVGGNGSAGQTPPFLQSGASATGACTISGASNILSVIGRAGFGQVVVSSTAAIPAIGGFAATAAGSGGNGAAAAASTSASAGSAGITGYVIVYEYN